MAVEQRKSCLALNVVFDCVYCSGKQGTALRPGKRKEN